MMAHNKGSHLHSSSGGSHCHRGRPYALMLLLAFGAALLGVLVLHKLRERRIYNLIVQDKDRQLLSLQLLLQKERYHTKEMKRKNEEMKAKIYALRSQKMELERRVVEMQSTMDSLKEEQKVMESAFEEKQNGLRKMQENGSYLGQGGSEVMALTENLKQKEAEIKELKHRVGIQVKPHLVIVTANGTTSAQDKTQTQNKEKDEHLPKSAKHGGDDKRITSEDASKSKSTKSKDDEAKVGVEDEIRSDDRIIETDEHTQKHGTWQVEGTGGVKITEEPGKKNEDHPQDDGGEGVTSKEVDDGGQSLNAKQSAESQGVAAGVKRNHGHESRTKGNWSTVMKNRLQGSSGISERHQVSRKGYRDEKSGLMERVSDDENVARGDESVNNDKPGEDRAHANLLKPENHEDRKESRKMIVTITNHHVTSNSMNIHPEKQRMDEMINSEEQDSLVQQKWNRRHINKADNDGGQAKPNIFHDESGELEATDAQKQEKDVIDIGDDAEDNDDDFSKESQSDFEDKEYKEEIDELEFHSGL